MLCVLASDKVPVFHCTKVQFFSPFPIIETDGTHQLKVPSDSVSTYVEDVHSI